MMPIGSLVIMFDDRITHLRKEKQPQKDSYTYIYIYEFYYITNFIEFTFCLIWEILPSMRSYSNINVK